MMNTNLMVQLFMLSLFTLLCCCVLLLRTLLLGASVRSWYYHLNRPSWTPPVNLIQNMWAVLFLLMAVAAWLIWAKLGIEHSLIPLSIFFAQLGLNLLWVILFFVLRSPAA